jgi:maltooligosyltrehalose trehalohydrolase
VTTRAVWAPRARTVALVHGGARHPCTRDARGWWHAAVPALAADGDYAFVLDDGPPLPDPRSAWQPAGVDGPSRVVDHAAFRWTDAGWQAPPLASGVLYELHVGTFTAAGTFDAAIARLDHLVALGVTHVELMPVAEFSGARGWGYDGVALFAPHAAYGGPAGLKRLVDACHARGLAVLLDVVYNHLGPVGNHLDRFGPYFTDRYRTAWGPALNFDGAGSDEVRRFVCDDALAWLRDYHCDGLRLDAVHAIMDASATHVLEQLASEVRELSAALGRHLVLIAESDLNDPRLVRPAAAGGYGLDAQWNDDFHHALHAVLTGERGGYYADFGTLEDVARALRRGFVYDGRWSPHRERTHGRPATGVGGGRLVGFLQNHDQIGNRARGERASHLLSPGRARIGAALVLTAPFVPLLFQGEEWGASTPFQYFTAHEDPALAEAVRTGRRREFAAFGWKADEVPDPQDEATFTRSRLDWDERERGEHAALLDWHRRLIALRRRVPALTDGRLDRVRVDYDEAARWLVVARGPVTVACNLGVETRDVPVPADGEPLLSHGGGVTRRATAVRLPPDGVVVLGPPA